MIFSKKTKEDKSTPEFIDKVIKRTNSGEIEWERINKDMFTWDYKIAVSREYLYIKGEPIFLSTKSKNKISNLFKTLNQDIDKIQNEIDKQVNDFMNSF